MENGTSLQTEHNRTIIAGIYKSGEQIYFINEGFEVERTVLERGADEFIFIDVQMNNEKYMRAIEDIISRKIDGVILCIPDQKLSLWTVTKLRDADIPVVATNDPLINPNGTLIAPFVGVNNRRIGEMNGDWMANYAIKSGISDHQDVGVLILTMRMVTSGVERAAGEQERFKEMLPGFPESRMFHASYNGETDKGFSAAIDVYAQHPEIKKWLVMSSNEEGAIGAVRALEQIGLDWDSCVVGLGGYLAKDEFKKEYSAMKAASFFSPGVVGRTAANTLMDWINEGKEMPMEQLFNGVIITKENYKEVMGEYAD
ncbi:substrate-binding domain-containing protein [Anaerotalea alkaliphila]|uniref:Substrate-binding domain-containing protein n=1 Tax=Anaerotalea alkaliphila TaxID=2662126 RepID=A0A7X5HWR4_9FIRM|nr:substrate-binding domain-containing protein [Anaerotalea alkaliphila]NDL68052.1 substrate-binding domain-containing protein [Anaerotalea alkaliphila]